MALLLILKENQTKYAINNHIKHRYSFNFYMNNILNRLHIINIEFSNFMQYNLFYFHHLFLFRYFLINLL